ncbi:hypothetical protein PsYK624_106930 [Phanerochaete sordida]|uniref:DUF6533 domain-containing protein n=1 Tax=Phanerochaete sordida TaxID=48140 RepID=A0A9P3GGJ4_9APHY|nr:hypothetical protein PsYK624_106930 [Phanerochaete sordida]
MASLADALHQFVTAGYTSAALSALVGYEYLITISQEVDSVWRRQFSLTSVLLISTRWVMLVNQIFQWLPASPHLSLDRHCLRRSHVAILCPSCDIFCSAGLCYRGQERATPDDCPCSRSHSAVHKHLWSDSRRDDLCTTTDQ